MYRQKVLECCSGAGPEKAAERLLFPRPFCYFLGRCQKVNKEKIILLEIKKQE